MSTVSTFALVPVVALLLLLPVLILGVVLFIVGLVKKRPAMWGSGIAIGVLGMLVLTVGAGLLMFLSASRARTQMMTQIQAASMGSDFQEITGLILPAGVSVIEQSDFSHANIDTGSSTRVLMLHMSIPANFDDFLSANFTKAQWSAVAPIFQAGRAGDETFLPGGGQLQAASLYWLTYQAEPNSPATFTTAVAHDANTQEAWAVSVEKPAPAE